MYQKKGLNLGHEEVLAKINKDTGEIKELKNTGVSSKETSVFLPKAVFTKNYKKTHSFLLQELNLEEKRVVDVLVDKAEVGTNRIPMIDNSCSARRLAAVFGINERRVKLILQKLHSLGVYAVFDNIWFLNPYIAFSGKTIDNNLYLFFTQTPIGLHFHDILV